MRRYLGLASAAFVLLAGCTSGSSHTSAKAADSGTTGATTAAHADDARAPGVTADTIKVGVSYVDLKAIRNLTTIDHGDYEAAYRAMFDDINAHGGINGRKIVPVFAPVNPVGTQPAEAACVKLTQDQQVFAVMGFFQSDAPLCYVETHDTAVIGGAMTPDRLKRAKAPWFAFDPSSDQESDVISMFAKKNLLDGKLAVFSTSLDQALLKGVVSPLLAKLGIKPVATSVLDAPDNDVAAQNAATQVIAEKFKSAGATKVLIIGDGGLTWANGVEKTDYRPQLLFTKINSIAAFYKDKAARDLSLMKGALLGDLYGPAAASRDEGKMKACLAIQEKAGLQIPADPDSIPNNAPNQYVSSAAACQNVSLFKAIAEKAGKTLNYGTFRNAGEHLGSFDMPGSPQPYHYGPAPALDGNPPIYLYSWNPATKGFDRSGS